MRTSELAVQRAAPAVLDPSFLRIMVLLNAAVPLGLLAVDALRGNLGVNGVNFAIRTTGILGLILLVLSLTITPLRELFGWNLLVAARRRLGVSAFAYILLHFLIYYSFDRAGSVGSTFHEILSRRYLQLGAIGLLFMVPLALTSTDAMVSRLGARRWKGLHRLAYLTAVLGGIHYLLLVKSDTRQPLAFLAVLSVLLGYRAVSHYVDLRRRAARATEGIGVDRDRRRRRFWKGELVVMKLFHETPDVKTFRLAARDGAPVPFDYAPGQYLNLALEIEGKAVRRSYTIASSPTRRDYCELTVKRKADGYVSKYLHDTLRIGDALRVSAPAGRFVFDAETASSVILIAAGVGITPLMSTLRALTDRSWKGEVHFVVSARTRRDVIFEEELRYLEKRFANLRLCIVLSQEPDPSWRGERGRCSVALLARVLPAARDIPVFLCGPDSMMNSVRAQLLELGFPAERVHTEAFVSPPPGEQGEQPAAAESLGPGSDQPVVIRFSSANRVIDSTGTRSVLEAAEEAGVSIPFECRSGICGQCRVRLLDGEVVMESESALTAEDRKQMKILACQAHPTTDVTIEA